MKRYLILFLMMCGVCWPANMIYMFGGTGANDNNAGICNFGIDPAACMTTVGSAATGDPLASTDTATYTAATGTITKVGAFASVALANGMWVAVHAGTGATPGRAAITSHTDDTIVCGANAFGASDNATGDWHIIVGGAIPATATNLNLLATGAAGTIGPSGFDFYADAETIDIMIYAETTNTIAFDDTWTFNTVSTGGTSSFPIHIYACDNNWDYVPWVTTITPSGAAAASLLVFGTTSDLSYVSFHGFILDGLNVSDNVVGLSSGHSGFMAFYDCDIRQGEANNVKQSGSGRVILVNCKVWDCVTTAPKNGVYSDAGTVFLINTLVYDNDGVGFQADGTAASVLNSMFYNTLIVGNIFANNGGDGIQMIVTDLANYIFGNIFYSNGAYGVNGTGIENITVLSRNFFYDNPSGGSNITPYASDALLQLAGNYTTDPLFTNPGAKDYSLQSTSPCLDKLVGSKVIGTADYAPNTGGSVNTGFNGGFDQ
jgi:hypothetical protein